jgi:lipid II:glycine glycyltransferase (peptidoglycan interpeptide bridge formation enzyme)
MFELYNFMENYTTKEEGFLQSEKWMKFQENTGKRTFHVEHGDFSANIIEHKLPIVGNYFYIPRGVAMEHGTWNIERDSFLGKLVSLAKKENIGWIRFDLSDSRALDKIRDNWRIAKAPHDMQPRENFVIDITKSEDELLNEMKQKTRYNINLSQKRGVLVKVISNFQFPISNEIKNSNDKNNKYYIDKFIELVSLTAKRKNVNFHPDDYYREMIESISGDILRLYCAEYNGKIIAANLVVFYGNTAIYLHGATDDEYRNVMAPYLLQWQAILDAKKAGCKRYDFGGIKTAGNNNWNGITKFKLGFSQITKPVEFLGSYDIVVNPVRYWIYRSLQKIKQHVSFRT